MKKVSIVLAAIMFCALVAYGSSQAAPTIANVVSEAESDVYGPSTTPFGGDPGSATLGSSVTLVPLTTWPTNGNLAGAEWITTEAQNATQTTYRLFQDSFVPASTATNLQGDLFTAANESQVVYLNGAALPLTGTDPSTTPPVATFALNEVLVPSEGTVCNENIFGFEVLTGPAGVPDAGGNLPNPAGLIYRANLTYDLPDVIWRPPIFGTGRKILKNGTTLPIKFRLKNADGIILTRQNIYLTITGPGETSTTEVAHFNLGRGSRNLRFAPGNGQYIANFHSKRFDLVTGEIYLVNVKDGCSKEVLGSIPMTISAKGGHKHGNGNGNGNGNGHGKGHGKK